MNSNYMVISDDVYLCAGLVALLSTGDNQRWTVIIDLDRVRDLASLATLLRSFPPESRVMGLGRGGILSGLFRGLPCLSLSARPPHIHRFLSQSGPSVPLTSDWLEHCESLIHCRPLSRIQREILGGLKSSPCIPEVAKAVAIDTRICYAHTRRITARLNLRNLTALCYSAVWFDPQ